VAEVDPDAVRAVVEGLEHRDESVDLVETLQQVNDGVVSLFPVSGAGMMFLDESAVSRYVVASDDRGRALEMAQEELGQGPCVDALVHDRVVTVEDFRDDPRWPALADIVVPVGVTSMVGLPLHLGGAAVGSLNLFRDAPSTWENGELDALGALTTVIESTVTSAVVARRQERLVGQLQYALDNRVVIERAVGLLMGRTGCEAVAAFNTLRSSARSQRRRVIDVAAELVGEEPAAIPSPQG
jgi:transcriptional regulator with GAF, ATPase, and Fis domain